MIMADLTTEQQAALKQLVDFGYLPKDKKIGKSLDTETIRATKRFQRHAARSYRLPQDTPDKFQSQCDGTLNSATVAEIDKWVKRKWKLPLGRFKLVNLPQGGKLRSDAAAAWDAIVNKVNAAGGTLEGPYGDTTRSYDFKAGAGASRHSFHYAGRAVDIQQALAGGRNQRYYVAKDANGADMFWRIWCKTIDATKGTAVKAKEKTYYDLYSRKELSMPAGNYVDLTQLIESDGTFERIHAQQGWEVSSKKLEWWHFQYTVDKQATIQDELELIGVSEAQLKQAGWLDKDLDHAPG
jgi:hypothetical protein